MYANIIIVKIHTRVSIQTDFFNVKNSLFQKLFNIFEFVLMIIFRI